MERRCRKGMRGERIKEDKIGVKKGGRECVKRMNGRGQDIRWEEGGMETEGGQRVEDGREKRKGKRTASEGNGSE